MRFPDLPRFPAEHFGRVRLLDSRSKQFDEGMQQLEEEGLMQVFFATAGRREPLIGVVGALQFEVIASRLKSEYGVATEIQPAPYAAARWVEKSSTAPTSVAGGSALAEDRHGRRVILFATEWELHFFERHHPGVALLSESPMTAAR
jgi:peptide chain release factor 3